MGKIKELFIQLMNEDWERISAQDQALIKAEREHMEQQIMQQILFEEQQAAKIQVVKEESPKKTEHDNRIDSLPF